ncbi:L-glyceraldehyde 3-phosphate reductase [Raoultella terrigena]|uniref:L-glyceraldehyde 3-phosphate reductase n=1 Tax=Raoultella terrigena TaxID=577 RepID=A0A485BY12_RAOTE|nr:L-glyceraldehyde 3-phosphate reductase [Raoultella terrigena]
MKYAELGKTGVYVSRICLGTMTFGGADNAAGNAIGRLTGKEADIIVGEALDAGINFIDTADVYGSGGSESVLGEVLAQRRGQVFLATKAHSRMNAGPNDAGQSRYHLMQALEASLRRLKTDHIDLYQVHNFDAATPPEEVLRTLDDMVRQGKVRYIGCSNYAGCSLPKPWVSRLNISLRNLSAYSLFIRWPAATLSMNSCRQSRTATADFCAGVHWQAGCFQASLIAAAIMTLRAGARRSNFHPSTRTRHGISWMCSEQFLKNTTPHQPALRSPGCFRHRR